MYIHGFLVCRYARSLGLMEFFGEDEYYVNAAQAMIDLDKEKEELAKSRDVSNKVNNLGFGKNQKVLNPNHRPPRRI